MYQQPYQQEAIPTYVEPDSPGIKVDEYAELQGEEAMMQEIYQRGPISCGVALTETCQIFIRTKYKDPMCHSRQLYILVELTQKLKAIL